MDRQSVCVRIIAGNEIYAAFHQRGGEGDVSREPIQLGHHQGGHLQRVASDMVEHFGAEKPLRDFTRGDGDSFQLYLIGRGLAENTVRRRCGRAEQFLTAAMHRGIAPTNPFGHLKSNVQANPERFYFVTPKTEHHAGGESRIVPLFPELRPHLEEAFEQAEPGTEYVITQYCDASQNLRSRLLDIIWAAGLKEWPKLFQNMRSTRETELAEELPMHVVCKWIGSSQPVVAKHYLQSTEENEALRTCTNVKAPRRGLEEGAFPSGKTHISDLGNARSNVTDAPEAQATHDPALALLAGAWPFLPLADKTAILAIVKAASAKGEGHDPD